MTRIPGIDVTNSRGLSGGIGCQLNDLELEPLLYILSLDRDGGSKVQEDALHSATFALPRKKNLWSNSVLGCCILASRLVN
jgi:hypothetical protein